VSYRGVCQRSAFPHHALSHQHAILRVFCGNVDVWVSRGGWYIHICASLLVTSVVVFAANRFAGWVHHSCIMLCAVHACGHHTCK